MNKVYKQPDTRIKHVSDGFGDRYYAQYKIVIIPFLLQGWDSIRQHIDQKDYSLSLYDAQLRIDKFLERDRKLWEKGFNNLRKKKIKKKTTIIKYPQEGL